MNNPNYPAHVFVVSKQDFSTGVMYEPKKVFLYEEDAQKYCQENNKHDQDYNYMAYQRVRLYR